MTKYRGERRNTNFIVLKYKSKKRSDLKDTCVNSKMFKF